MKTEIKNDGAVIFHLWALQFSTEIQQDPLVIVVQIVVLFSGHCDILNWINPIVTELTVAENFTTEFALS